MVRNIVVADYAITMQSCAASDHCWPTGQNLDGSALPPGQLGKFCADRCRVENAKAVMPIKISFIPNQLPKILF